MRMLVTHVVAQLAAALGLAAAAAAQAQVLDLADPGAFSGSETQLDFESPGFSDGLPVSGFGGVAVGLEGAGGQDFGGAIFGFANEPREFGPPDTGSLNNFAAPNLGRPYPMIRFGFGQVVHRVSLEVRASTRDELIVSFWLGGAMVAEARRQNPSSGIFHFHGFEVPDGFDEVLVDAADVSSGAIAVDNLTFEAIPEPPPDEVPVFTCDGFYRITEKLGSKRAENAARLARLVMGAFARKTAEAGDRPLTIPEFIRDSLNVRLLRADLFDAHGVVVTNIDLVSAPVVQVIFDPAGPAPSLDISADAVRRGITAFRFSRAGHWRKELRGKALEEPGTYVVTLESGDPEEYAVESCVEWIVVGE